ncbi:MAG: response regulator [Nitriliruptorales bacterium]
MSIDPKPILVVEDEPQHATLIRAALDTSHVVNPVVVASDGDEAIAYLSGDGEYVDRTRHPLPALVLLDLHLPRVSGLDVLGWMKTQPEVRRLPVIMLTASQDDDDIRAAYDLGANSYLVKPVGFDALLDVVKGLSLYWLVLNRPPADG